MTEAQRRHAFFQRFQRHDRLRYVGEPERTYYMKWIWSRWQRPPEPTGKSAYERLREGV